MADGTHRDEEDEGVSDDEAALSARLQRLGERLDRHQASRPVETGVQQKVERSAFARAFRLSSELIGAVILGAALGWATDRWLGISPWGLIVFLLLGFAAGVLNVIRAAGTGTGPSARTDQGQ